MNRADLIARVYEVLRDAKPRASCDCGPVSCWSCDAAAAVDAVLTAVADDLDAYAESLYAESDTRGGLVMTPRQESRRDMGNGVYYAARRIRTLASTPTEGADDDDDDA